MEVTEEEEMKRGMDYGALPLGKCPACTGSRRTMPTVPVCWDENTVGCGCLGVSMTEKEQVLCVDGPFSSESNILESGLKRLIVCRFGREERGENQNLVRGHGGFCIICSLEIL